MRHAYGLESINQQLVASQQSRGTRVHKSKVTTEKTALERENEELRRKIASDATAMANLQKPAMERENEELKKKIASDAKLVAKLERKLVAQRVDLAGVQYFKDERQKFASNEKVLWACLEWEYGNLTGREAMEMTEGKLQGMCPKVKKEPVTESKSRRFSAMQGDTNDNPLFTKFVDDMDELMPDDIFFEDEDMLIFPNREGHQRSASGKSAAMSYVHFMIVPKARIYNCVSLRPGHIALLRKVSGVAYLSPY
jgi:hypothetical protein